MSTVAMPFTDTVVTTPREAAVDWVRYQIEWARWKIDRCETEQEKIQVIKDTQMGYAGPELWASVGGFTSDENGRVYHNASWVVVRKFDGVDVNVRFPLREIFREAIADGHQMELFNAD